MCRTRRKGKRYFFSEQSELGEKRRRCQVGGKEEETKLMFIDFESFCYVDVFILFC